MTDTLFEPAPGFDRPVAVLRHCHDRIRKQLHTLDNLARHMQEQGASVDAQQAATAVLRYFEQSAPNHHADEEEDLLPMLATVAAGDEADRLRGLTTRIAEEHRKMDAAWDRLAQPLRAIAEGKSVTLPRDEVAAFADSYRAHMELEEGQVAPMAVRLFSAEQMARLGDAMRARRGITN